MKKERLRVGLIYLAISAILVALSLWPIRGIWYPDVMPVLFGLNKILTIFTITNMVIFPFIAILICKEDKKEQKRDLITISVIQTIITGIMIYFLYYSRPMWMGFAIDNFEITRQKDIQDDSQLTTIGIFQPYQTVGISFSKSPEIAEKQKTADLQGTSIFWFPSAIVPLAEKQEFLKRYAQPLADLKKYNPTAEVERVLQEYPTAAYYFPLKGYIKDGSVLTNKSFSWFKPVNLWPWEQEERNHDANSKEQ